jgi:hypothetical protein
LNIWIGQLQARALWGRLNQSAYSPVAGSAHYVQGLQSGTIRLTASLDAVFQPRGIPGLELGAARFFHVPYTDGEPNAAFWKKPLAVFFYKNEVSGGESVAIENQLASIFFRWVFPHSGLEIFGERGYEDQFYDFREFLENLDHDREYMIGLQKVLATRSDGFDVLRAEVINYQLSSLAIIRPGEGAVYLHSSLRQGHTNRGQLLGASPGVNAAAAATLAWTRYPATAKTSFTLRRIVRDQVGDYYLTGLVNPRGSDVLLATGFERTRYGRNVDFGAKIEVMDELNRNFLRDVGNLNLQLTTRLHR